MYIVGVGLLMSLLLIPLLSQDGSLIYTFMHILCLRGEREQFDWKFVNLIMFLYIKLRFLTRFPLLVSQKSIF